MNNMHIFLPCILFLFILPSFDGDEITDRLALMSFKEHVTLDPNQIMSSWNDSVHFCNWTGIVCDLSDKRVVILNLWSSGLSGSISPAISNMSFLRELLLNNNSFTGNLPQEVGRLSRLTRLGITNNSLSGEIPSNLSRCLNLVTFNLSGNNFIGIIPNEFESLTKLQVFDFHSNNLTGEIPKFIGNFTSLKYISGGSNNFHGTIPDTLGMLSHLLYFGFYINNLSGILPSSFFNLSSLNTISLSNTAIGGNLPADIAQRFPRLEFLNLPVNKFTGQIPFSLSNLSNLEHFDLGGNLFTGTVPRFDKLTRLTWFAVGTNLLGNGSSNDLDFVSSLANCTNLSVLVFGNNNLGGVLPKPLYNFTQLTQLLGHRNLISGNILEIGQLVNLQILRIHSNRFTGNIPESIGNLRNLGVLSLQNNSFSGSIPFSLGNLTLLFVLDLYTNNLEGAIPYTLSNFSQLQLLQLDNNNLNGYIPKEIFSLTSLTLGLGLSNNHFVGSLPSEIGNFENLQFFSVSNNNMSGVIPSSFGKCTSLVDLSLSGNTFQGEIPDSFSSLKGLESLDLSDNNLTGKIPSYLKDFVFLRNLNLSFNKFEGKLPDDGAFKNASIVSVNGNAKLCGGVQEFHLPECTLDASARKNHTSHFLKIIIPIVSVMFFLMLAIAFYLVYKRKYGKKTSPESDSDIESFPQVSYRDLQKATNGFSSENLIGSGKFSSVYKAVLSQKDGPQVVAVKVLKLAVRGAHKTFIAEGEALRRIRHRNLVKIVTSCSSIDLQGNDFKAIVYSYMENGSLEDWLHQNPVVGHEIEDATRYLNFVQRLNIVIDVARALDYIHCQCGSPMVHCDIKPSNILLDVNLVAHLGDFGLARFLQYTSHDFSTSHTSSLSILGTIGYAAPEYGMGGQTSTYGDIYSFGILILETFTRKRPTHEMFRNGLSLHEFVKMAIPDQVMEITDPVLLEIGEDENARYREYRLIKESLTTIYQIGITCSMESPKDRIEMSNVFDQLQSVKKTFLGGANNSA